MNENTQFLALTFGIPRLLVFKLCLFLLHFSNLQGQNEVKPADSLELMPYQGYGVELQVPVSWEITQDYSRYIQVLFSNQDSSAKDSLIENIALCTERLLFQSLRSYFKLSKRSIDRELLDVVFLSEGKKQVNNFACQWLIYTHRLGGKTFKVKAYFFVQHNTAYVLMLTTWVEHFKESEKIFEQVLKTFRITR